MKHWWNQRQWRLIQTNLRQIDMEDIDASQYVEQLKDFKATVAMINTGGMLASYETNVEDHVGNNYLKGDSLKQIMDACHEADIKVIARMDFSKVRRSVYEKHPDWAYRTANGEIVDYNGDVHMCICGGFQQEKSFEIMREAAETLPIDGVFINMGGFRMSDYSYRYYGICHCDNCKRRFKEEFGLDLPDREDMNDIVYRKYKIFQNHVMEDYRQRMNAMLKAINPEIAVDGVDFSRIESNTEYKRKGPQWQYSSSSSSRCARSLNPENICSNATVDFIGFFYRHVAVGSAMQSLRLWQDVANYGSLDYYLMGRLDNHKDRSSYASVKKAFEYVSSHEQDYKDMQIKGDVLLLRQGRYGITPEACGWIRALTESHILLEEADPGLIHEETELDRYKAVIVADIHTIPETLAIKLDSYVNKGGCLIITGETGRFDGDGNQRENIPFKSIGSKSVKYHRNDMESGMFEIPMTEKELFPSLSDTDVIYFGDDYLFVDYEDEVEKHLHLIPPHPYGPPERCYYEHITDLPGFTVHHYGEGTAVMIPWNPGLLYHRDGYSNTFGFMKDIITSIAGISSVEEVPFTEMVEVTLGFEKNGSHAMVQLVNGTGHFGRSFFKPVKVQDINLRIPMKVKPVRLYQFVGQKEVPFRWDGETLSMTVDSLGEFECINIEFE